MLNTLKNKNIDYILYCLDGSKEEVHTNNNNYNKVLNAAYANYDINKKIKDITLKVSKLDSIKLNNLIKVIEEYLDE